MGNTTFALLFSLTGMVVYLYLLNHHLFALTDGVPKLLSCLFVLLLFVFVLPIIVYLVGPQWPLPHIVAFLLLLTLCGELRRFFRRVKYKGLAPVERKGPKLSLLKPVTTYQLLSLRYEIPCPHIGQTTLRTVLLSDFHINERTAPELYERAFAMAQEAKPDILIFGGDYLGPLSMKDDLQRLAASVKGSLGTFGVIGNHDHWFNRDEIVETLKDAGVDMLGNRHRILKNHDGEEILVGGCETPWHKEQWQALEENLPPLRIIASHTPDNVFHLAQESKATLVLSGHTHAGQGRIPGYGSAIIPSVHGRLFDHGHFVVDNTHLVVSAGVGVQIPLRIYCQPDVTIVDLVPEKL